MPTYLFMNHRIREDKPTGPVIRAIKSGSRAREANDFEIWVNGRVVARVVYDPKRNPSRTHQVKAWVEVYDGGRSGVCVVKAAK